MLGAALQAGRTPAAAGVDVIYGQARSSFEHSARREQLIPVIRGEYLFHVARAEYDAALDLAQEMLGMARQDERAPWLAEGLFYQGFTRMLRGELDPARGHLEEAIELLSPGRALGGHLRGAERPRRGGVRVPREPALEPGPRARGRRSAASRASSWPGAWAGR